MDNKILKGTIKDFKTGKLIENATIFQEGNKSVTIQSNNKGEIALNINPSASKVVTVVIDGYIKKSFPILNLDKIYTFRIKEDVELSNETPVTKPINKSLQPKKDKTLLFIGISILIIVTGVSIYLIIKNKKAIPLMNAGINTPPAIVKTNVINEVLKETSDIKEVIKSINPVFTPPTPVGI